MNAIILCLLTHLGFFLPLFSLSTFLTSVELIKYFVIGGADGCFGFALIFLMLIWILQLIILHFYVKFDFNVYILFCIFLMISSLIQCLCPPPKQQRYDLSVGGLSTLSILSPHLHVIVIWNFRSVFLKTKSINY